MSFYQAPTQYNTRRTATHVSQQQQQAQVPLSSNSLQVSFSDDDYSEPLTYGAPPRQYGTHQTSGSNMPQQHRQSVTQARTHAPLASTSPRVSSRGDYQDQTYLYSGAPQAQQGYSDPAEYDYLSPTQGNPGFPEPHPSPGNGSIQLSHSGGQSGALYGRGGGTGPVPIQRSHSGQPETVYVPTSSSIPRAHSGQPETIYSATSSSVPRAHSGQPETIYAATSSSVSRAHSGRPADYYPAGASAFDSTNTSYPGPQPTSHHLQVAPHGHGRRASASDGSRSGHQVYQTTAPVTRVTPEPPYRGARSQERTVATSQPQYLPADEYANEGHISEHRPKGPGRVPVQGRQRTCRMAGCNRPMFFDRRFNDFWEWCSPQHIHEALGRGMEKVCRGCRVWPRKQGYRYCGGDGCNRQGYPI